MENLHEMGFRIRELKRKRTRLAVEVIGFLSLSAFLVLAGARIDGLERELALAQNRGQSLGVAQGPAKGQSPVLPETVWVGVKRATLESGDVVLRVGVVGEERPKAEGRSQSAEGRSAGKGIR